MNGFDSNVVRVPVAGPEPFNTLVVVRENRSGPGVGHVTHSDDVVREPIIFETDFTLIGYDPWRDPTPPFVHSTTVVMDHIQLGDDTNFLAALDGVRAGFNASGKWTIEAETAVFNEPGGFFSRPNFLVLSAWASSWVLCHEPRPEKPWSDKSGTPFHRFSPELTELFRAHPAGRGSEPLGRRRSRRRAS